jgi:ketosteroid isomerase-like protein
MRRLAGGASEMRTNGRAIKAIRAADAAWLKAFRAKDLEASVAFLDANGSMLVPHAPIVTGKKAVKRLIAAGFALKDYKLAWRPNKAGVARSGELGYTSGKYKVSFKDASGRTIFEKGKYLMVWKKQKSGDWKVLFDMNNSDLPPSLPG